MLPHTCPLCGENTADRFFQDARREYLRCRTCRLVFVPPAYYLSPVQERAEYDLHRNHPADQGYRRFLNRLFQPLNQVLAPESQGLDFGCGPGPALAQMFAAAGHTVAVYDPYYEPDASVLADDYDFITASEVLEHLHAPGRVLADLFNALKPMGSLGVMTGLVRDQTAFSKWQYIRDLTHVCFFSEFTFKWIAEKWGARLRLIDDRVVLFTKVTDDSSEESGGAGPNGLASGQ